MNEQLVPEIEARVLAAAQRCGINPSFLRRKPAAVATATPVLPLDQSYKSKRSYQPIGPDRAGSATMGPLRLHIQIHSFV